MTHRPYVSGRVAGSLISGSIGSRTTSNQSSTHGLRKPASFSTHRLQDIVNHSALSAQCGDLLVHSETAVAKRTVAKPVR